MATSRTSAACSVESCFRCTGRFTLLRPLEPPVPNVGQLDCPQHGLDKPGLAVGEVVNDVGCFGPEVGDEDGDERELAVRGNVLFHQAGGLAL